MPPRKNPKTSLTRPQSLNLKDHQLDIKKTLAERLERQKKEQEFGFPPGDSNDSILTIPSFSDSLMELSQEVTPVIDSKQSLHRIIALEIFCESKTFHLFNEDTVRLSQLDPKNKIKDFDETKKISSHYILSEFKAYDLRHSTSKCLLISRFILFLLSVTTDKDVLCACIEIMEERISSSEAPHSIAIHDLLLILTNYGAPLDKLWQKGNQISLKNPFIKKKNSETEYPMHTLAFPIHNLVALLSLVRLNINTFPQFTVEEKVGLFYLFLNLSMDKMILKTRPVLELVKSLMTSVLDCFSQEEWDEGGCMIVEELTLYIWDCHTEAVEIVQRIGSIPVSTLRGIQVQQAAAFNAVQHMLDFDEITVSGIVTIDDLLEVILKAEKFPSNYEIAYCLVKAISFCVDVTNPSMEKDKINELGRALNDWRHSIRDVSVDCDTNRLAVKDLITELTVNWRDPFPINNVV